jgi:hypothetical protein
MRAVIVIVLAAIVSGLVAAAVVTAEVYLNLAVDAGADKEFAFTALVLGEVVVAIGTAVTFAIVVAAGGRLRALQWAAIGLVALLVSVLSAPVILGVATSDAEDIMARDALWPLAILLIAAAVPGLVAIFIQWWIARRYLFRDPTPTGISTGQK